MLRLVETIRSEDGILKNLSFHDERLNRSISDLFGKRPALSLEELVKVPVNASSGIFKCRVEYDFSIRKIEFIEYEARIIRSLKLIEDNSIDYSYKYTDRKRIEELFSRREGCDEILIIKNGIVTDSSYANIILRDQRDRWITPDTYLLAGTRRASLLKKGLIAERRVTYKDIEKYSEVKLINAMLDIDDSEAIPLSGIL
jgi:4-amino-4-deoxychorismate lyase